MTSTVSIILLSTIIFLGGNSDDPTSWKKVHSREDIVVSERWVTYPNGVKTRERKGEFMVEADPEKLLELLKDANKASTWMRSVSEHSTIGTQMDNAWYSYTIYDIPWPFKSQDLVSLYEYERLPSDIGYKVNISSVDDGLPKDVAKGFYPQPDLKRLSDYMAEWIIESKSSTSCMVRFTASSQTPPPFPRWIMDPVLIRLFEDNLFKFRELAQNEIRSYEKTD